MIRGQIQSLIRLWELFKEKAMKEFCLTWRRDFPVGNIKFNKGDSFWSTCRPKVIKMREFFILCLSEDNPLAEQFRKYFKDSFDTNWTGEFIVPCSYIKFNEDVPNSRIKDKK
jgi:hypothetical protein